MQDHDSRKAIWFNFGLQHTSQQKVAALAEALKRWLDDGGASDDAPALQMRVRDFSPLQFFPRSQGGLL